MDESGTPAKPDKDRPRYFVIAGVVIPEERWHEVSNKLHGLKVRCRYHGEVKWRFFAPGNDDTANPMRQWNQEKRNLFRREIFDILRVERSIKVIASVAECAAAYKLAIVDDQQDIYFRTYKVLTERFQYLLQDIGKSSGRNTLGIIVADHRGKGDDDKMRKQHQRLVEQDVLFVSRYNNLVEGLFLAPSHLSVGIQFADMVAGALWRRFEADDSTWYDLIRSSLRKGPNDTVDGFGVARFPKSGWTGVIL